jgi:DNA mismatch repair protein MutS
VSEHRGEVVFLRKVVAGAASRSYGIEVARLAGLPRSVIARAQKVLQDLESPKLGSLQNPQLSLLSKPEPPAPSALEAALGKLDPNLMTPLQALQALADLKLLSKSGG